MKLVKARSIKSTKRAKSDKAVTKNPVAKHAGSFNKAQVHKDRKKAAKRGYTKFKSNFKTQDYSKAA